jgi:hypothetical protein
MCRFMLKFACTVYSRLSGVIVGRGCTDNTKRNTLLNHEQKIKLIYSLYTYMAYTYYLRKWSVMFAFWDFQIQM